MIQVEILSSPDQLIKGPITIFRHLCLISQNNGDILINDPQILDGHLVLEVQEKTLYVHKHPQLHQFKINGKLASTSMPLSLSDILEFGQTSMRILAFQYRSFPSKKDLIQSQVTLISQDSSYQSVRELLTLIQENLES
jgi:hypothetical protein